MDLGIFVPQKLHIVDLFEQYANADARPVVVGKQITGKLL